MDPRYARPASPGSRRLVQQPARSSTGTLMYPSSYDPYTAPTRSSRELTTGSRSSIERVPPRSLPHNYKDANIPVRNSRDDYAPRPRRLTLDTNSTSTRRPLSIVGTSSPNRPRPLVTSAIDRPSSPLAKSARPRGKEDYYVLPASSSSRREHRPSYSLGSADLDRLTTGEKETRDRIERGGYKASGYNVNAPLVRQPQGKEDRAYGYEYPERRDAMYRETAPKQRPRQDNYNSAKLERERPLSMAGVEDHLPRLPPSSRDAGPSVKTRQFEKIGRSESLRHDLRTRDDDLGSRDYPPGRPGDIPDVAQKRKTPRQAVDLHQDLDDGYSLYRDDLKEAYDPRRRSSRKAPVDEEVEQRGYGIRPEPKAQDPYDDQYDRNAVERPRKPHEKSHHREREDVEDRDRKARDYEKGYQRERDDVEDRDRKARDYEKGYQREHDDVGDRDRKARDEPQRDKRDRGDDLVSNGLLVGAAGVAAGAAAEGVRHRHHREKEPRDKEPREREARDKDVRVVEPRERDARDKEVRNVDTSQESREAARDRLPVAQVQDPIDASSMGTTDLSDEERRERRRRRKERKERELEEQRKVVEDLALPRENVIREQGSYERGPRENRDIIEEPQGSSHHHRHTNDRDSYDEDSASEFDEEQSRRSRHHRHTRDKDSYDDDSSDEYRESPEPRPNRVVRVVTPSQEKEPEPPIRGILRPPRPQFPEDPAPIREGVAPLKDAGKKGVPANARWTKIDRKLVNPEALVEGNERFEERVDCVIVLRVLTKEEIQEYAAKTADIRDERASIARRRERERRRREEDAEGEDEEEERPTERLAIEGAGFE